MTGAAMAHVKAVALSQEQDEPVKLWCEDTHVAHVGVERDVQGHGVEREAVVLAIHPVHVGEERDTAQEEAQQHHATVHFVQPAVLLTHLQGEIRDRVDKDKEYLTKMVEVDGGSALCGV